MSEIFLGYLVNSILRGGILVLMLLIAEFALRRRMLFAGGRTLYLLAMVLVLLPLEQLSGFRSAASPLAESIEVPFENRFSPPTVPEGTSMNSGGAAANAVEKSDTAPRILPAETESPEVASSRPASWLMIFYLAGATLLTADQLRRLLLWRRRIRRCPAITGGEVFEQFLAAKRLAGVERFPIALRDCGSLLPVAACFGTLRHGTVLCPQEHYAALPEAALRMIFIHELEHLRRGDNPAGFLLTLLANLLFPNWFLRFLITRYAMVAELDCDERVRSVLALDRQGQAQYAELLLAGQSNRRILLPGHTLGSSARTLKFRIQEVFMQHSKRQRLTRLFLFGTLFAAGALFLPELRAGSLREPVPEFVAEHLPADAKTLLFFRGSGLDAEGIKLLDAAQQFVAPLGESYLSLLSLMKTTAGTGGFFYQVFTSGKQEYILLKNGGDSNQMLLGPSQWYQEKSIQALGNGSFLLSTVSRKKTERKWGLPRDLREKAAAGPNDIVRAVRIDSPGELRVFKQDGIYRLTFPVTPQLAKDLTPELLLEKATARLPEKKKADAIEFLRKTVQFTSRDLAGRKISFVEFPLSRQSISLWIEFFRRLRDEKMAAAIPHVIALEPANGAQNVDPNLSEIRVTFDRPMSPNSWSFCQRGADNFPDFLAKPSFNADRTVITVPVRLRPEWNYYIFLNSPPFLGFRSAQGGILPAVPWSFSTGKLPASGAGNGSETAGIDHKNIKKQ